MDSLGGQNPQIFFVRAPVLLNQDGECFVVTPTRTVVRAPAFDDAAMAWNMGDAAMKEFMADTKYFYLVWHFPFWTPKAFICADAGIKCNIQFFGKNIQIVSRRSPSETPGITTFAAFFI